MRDKVAPTLESAKDAVLRVYPHAWAAEYANGWQIEITNRHALHWASPTLGHGATEQEAWEKSALLLARP